MRKVSKLLIFMIFSLIAFSALIINSSAAITVQPDDVEQVIGANAIFKVSVSDENPTYQWQYSWNSGENWKATALTGNTTDTLTVAVNAGRDGYLYRCVIKSDSGSETSRAAKLTVKKESVVINSQPEDASGFVGETAQFTVAATGENLSYQWQYSWNSGANWSNTALTGNTTDTLSVAINAGRNGYLYRCVIKGGGVTVTSDAAKLTVKKQSVVITSQPEDASGFVGETVQFAVAATGENLSYQWQYSWNSGANWSNTALTGNTTDTLSVAINAGRNGYLYRCVIKGEGCSVTSNAAKLTAKKQSVVITAQPEDASGFVGETAQFTVAATGESLSYQWQYSWNSGENWKATALTGNTTDTLSVAINAGRNGYLYRCVIKGEGGSVTSNAAKLTVKQNPVVITSQPEDASGYIGETAQFTVAATGENLSYQWQYSWNSGENWKATALTGNTTDTLSVAINAGRNGYLYRCVIKGEGSTVTSNAAKLTVKKDPIVITSQPEDASGLIGATVQFTVAATGENLSYQWQYSWNSGENWKATALTGNKTDTLSVAVNAGRNGYLYRCEISDDYSTVTSDPAELKAEAVIKTQPSDVMQNVGSNAEFSVAVLAVDPSYQWQISTDGGETWNDADLAGSDTVTLTVPVRFAEGEAHQFRCVITDRNNTLTSDAATLTVGTEIPAVTGLTVEQNGLTTATLSWNKFDFVQGYYVQQLVGSEWTTIATIGEADTASYVVGDLVPGNEYSFRVLSFYDEYIGEPGEAANLVVVVPKVTGLTAATTPSVITLSWDKIDGVSGYYVQQKDGDEWKTIVPAVTGISAEQKGNDSFVITWDQSANAKGYYIRQLSAEGEDDSAEWTDIETINSASTTSYEVCGLEAGKNYTFGVAPFYDGFEGQISRVAVKIILAEQAADEETGTDGSQPKEKEADTEPEAAESAFDPADATTFTISSLKPETSYTFRVVAFYEELEGEPSDELTAVTTAVPKVTGVSVTPGGTHFVEKIGEDGKVVKNDDGETVYEEAPLNEYTYLTIEWDGIEGVFGFEIFNGEPVAGENGGFENMIAYATGNSAKTTISIIPGRDYDIRVRAYCLGDAASGTINNYYGELSDPVETIKTVIPTVSNVSVTEDNLYTITVKWDCAEADKIAGYAVFDGDKLLKEVEGREQREATVEVAPNESHEIKVCSYIEGANKNHYSAPSDAITVSQTVPQVSNLIFSETSFTSGKLSWTPADGVDGYYIYEGDELIGTVTEGSSFDFTVVPEMNHNYVVKSYVSGKAATYEGEGAAVDAVINIPAVDLQKVSYNRNSHLLTITWGEIEGVTGYEIYSETSEGDSSDDAIFEIIATSQTSPAKAAGDPNTTYKVTVKAYVEVNGEKVYGPSSNEISKLTIMEQGLSRVKNVNISQTAPDSATLTWTAMSGIDGYYIQQKTASNEWETVSTITDIDATSKTVDGLMPNSAYSLRVVAFSGSKIGPGVAKDVFLAFNAVSDLKVISANDKAAELSWTPSTSIGISGYRIYVGDVLKATIDKNASYYIVTGLDPQTKYDIKVATYYGEHEIDATAKVTTAPAPVSGLKIVYASESIVYLTWSNDQPVTGCYIYENGKLVDDNTSGSGRMFNGDSTKDRYVNIVPYTKDDSGKVIESAGIDYSKTVTASRRSDGYTDISWDAVDGAEGYIVEVAGFNTGKSSKTWSTVFNSVNGGGSKSATSARVLLADNFDYVIKVTAYEKCPTTVSPATEYHSHVFIPMISMTSDKYSPRCNINSLSKEKIVLAAVQAINNTKSETNQVKVDAKTNISGNMTNSRVVYDWGLLKNQTAGIEWLLKLAGGDELVGDLNSAMGDDSTSTGTFNNGTGSVTVSSSAGNQTTDTTLFDFVTPQGKLAYLYNANGIEDNATITAGSNGTTKITFNIKKETATPSNPKTPVHDGLVEGFADAIDSMSEMDPASSIESGVTSVTVVINADGTLNSMNAKSPFVFKMKMPVNESLAGFDIKRIEMELRGNADYSYTFTR